MALLKNISPIEQHVDCLYKNKLVRRVIKPGKTFKVHNHVVGGLLKSYGKEFMVTESFFDKKRTIIIISNIIITILTFFTLLLVGLIQVCPKQ